MIRGVLPDSNVFSSDVKTTQKNVFSGSMNVENIYFVGLFLFALINTVVISYYWVVVRKREIAIRKAFGANDSRIIGLMMGEFT